MYSVSNPVSIRSLIYDEIDGKAMLEIIETQGNSGFVTLRALLPLEKEGPILTLLRSIRANKEVLCMHV